MQFIYNGTTYEGRQDHVKQIEEIVARCVLVVPPKKATPDPVKTKVEIPKADKPKKKPK